jgi:DNA-binding response OmpR family regulator
MGLLPLRVTILVIEGDDLVSATIADMLDVDGYGVLSAWGAAEARAHLLTTPVDLIICNAVLPDSSGSAFLQGLRDDPTLGAIPAILISTSPEPRWAMRPYRAFLAMPFHMDELLQLVAMVLSEVHH